MLESMQTCKIRNQKTVKCARAQPLYSLFVVSFCSSHAPNSSYKLVVGRHSADYSVSVSIFFLFFLLIFGRLRSALHQLVHILLCFGVLVLGRHRSHTLWHLLIVATGRLAVLGRRNSLTKLIVLEVNTLSQKGTQTPCRSRQLQELFRFGANLQTSGPS